MAAAVVQNFAQEELFVSRATIQLQLPPGGASSPPVFEWRTQVVTPTPTPVPAQEEECISSRHKTKEAATPKKNYYERALGSDPKGKKNLLQTMGNFFEAERHASASNRVTK
nr:uncharacterized protein LOC108068554 [Drosophila takahashii]